MWIMLCVSAFLVGCASEPPSASQHHPEPVKWYAGTVELHDGRAIVGKVGWKPLTQQYVVNTGDLTISIPKAKVKSVEINDPSFRRDPWEMKGP